eukprot:s1424_g8.t1
MTPVYGHDSQQQLELLLDEECFGATDLHGRCPPLRGIQVQPSQFRAFVCKVAVAKNEAVERIAEKIEKERENGGSHRKPQAATSSRQAPQSDEDAKASQALMRLLQDGSSKASVVAEGATASEAKSKETQARDSRAPNSKISYNKAARAESKNKQTKVIGDVSAAFAALTGSSQSVRPPFQQVHAEELEATFVGSGSRAEPTSTAHRRGGGKKKDLARTSLAWCICRSFGMWQEGLTSSGAHLVALTESILDLSNLGRTVDGSGFAFLGASCIGKRLGPIKIMEGYTYLQTLDFSDNLIKDVAPLKGLNLLVKLNLAKNSIANLKGWESEEAIFPNLVELNLNDNQLSALHAMPYQALTSLSVARNEIASSELGGHDKIQNLDLSSNKLPSLTGLGALPSLRTLNEYGSTKPFFKLAALIVLPCTVISLLMASGYTSTSICKMISLLGAAYAFGSNVWLLRYGPRMYAVCCKESSWLGKEAFSTIQAACFPEYFALQSGSCILALAAANSLMARLAMASAIALALVNQLALGPKTAQLMVKLYEKSSGADASLLNSSTDVKKKFGRFASNNEIADLNGINEAPALEELQLAHNKLQALEGPWTEPMGWGTGNSSLTSQYDAMERPRLLVAQGSLTQLG